jgi:hypothetical protein
LGDFEIPGVLIAPIWGVGGLSGRSEKINKKTETSLNLSLHENINTKIT